MTKNNKEETLMHLKKTKGKKEAAEKKICKFNENGSNKKKVE